MFGFGKKINKFAAEPVVCDKNSIVAPVSGKQIAIELVKDTVFSNKMMGDGIAFECEEDFVTVCTPANGELAVLFPTGHAFGITMSNGVEILVHIGLDTVVSAGEGFEINPSFRQGDMIVAGSPVVAVDLKKLRKNYDMTLMLIIINSNGKKIKFSMPAQVKRGSVIAHVG